MAIIEDAELTWSFLNQEWPFETDVARPLDKLMAGDVEDVVGAAQGYDGSTFT